jgi:hypothetical protein
MDSVTPTTTGAASVSGRRDAPRQVTCLLPIWGLPYVRRFLTVALPTWLAPGNLPAVARLLPTELVILTTRNDEAYLRSHPAFRRLAAMLPVRLVFIDHLITGNNYSTTITLAYTEAVRAAGTAMLDTCFVFLVGDYIVADGSFGHVIERMLAGRSGILVGNFQVSEEDAAAWLNARLDASPDALALPPRRLVEWGLSHLHPATLANIVNSGIIRNAHTNRLFWRVDGRTLIGRFFLMHMICIRPETTEFVIGASCDYSFIPEMCPSDDVEIITDSDRYLVIEMQPRSHESSFLRARENRPDWLARSLTEWTTARHRRNADTTIVFHADAIPEILPATVAAADAFVAALRTRMAPVPKPHRNHPYWTGAIASFREAIGASLSLDERLFALGYIQFDPGRISAIRRWAGRLVARIFGIPPHLSRWNPFWADYRLVFEALDRGGIDTAHVLLVSEAATLATTWLADGGERTHRIRTSRLLSSEEALLAPLARRFDLCLVELSESEAAMASRVMERVEPLMRDGGTLLVSTMPRRYNVNISELKASCGMQMSRLLRPSARSFEFELVPMNILRRIARAGIGALVKLVGAAPRLGYLAAAVAAPPLLLLGWLGNWLTRSRRGRIPSGRISSALITITIDGERSGESFSATLRSRKLDGAQPARPPADAALPRPALASPPATTSFPSESAPACAPAPPLPSTGDSTMAQAALTGDIETREPQYNRCLDIKATQGLTPLGLMTNQVWEDDPRRLTFLLSRYKFVSKMLSGRKLVAELGCGDAFGTRVVMQEVERVIAYDFDPVFVEDIRSRRSERWPVEAHVHDILQGQLPHSFDAIYSLDVIEHIRRTEEHVYLTNLRDSLTHTGTLIIGSPSLESQAYASPPSKAGHVNCKSGRELKSLLGHYFHNVFLFSMNDEVVHTGYSPMAHYLFAICCQKS